MYNREWRGPSLQQLHHTQGTPSRTGKFGKCHETVSYCYWDGEGGAEGEGEEGKEDWGDRRGATIAN